MSSPSQLCADGQGTAAADDVKLPGKPRKYPALYAEARKACPGIEHEEESSLLYAQRRNEADRVRKLHSALRLVPKSVLTWDRVMESKAELGEPEASRKRRKASDAIASSDVSRGKKAAKVDNPAQKRESIVLVDDEDQLQGQLKSRDSLSMDAVTERARAKYALARPWESSVQVSCDNLLTFGGDELKAMPTFTRKKEIELKQLQKVALDAHDSAEAASESAERTVLNYVQRATSANAAFREGLSDFKSKMVSVMEDAPETYKEMYLDDATFLVSMGLSKADVVLQHQLQSKELDDLIKHRDEKDRQYLTAHNRLVVVNDACTIAGRISSCRAGTSKDEQSTHRDPDAGGKGETNGSQAPPQTPSCPPGLLSQLGTALRRRRSDTTDNRCCGSKDLERKPGEKLKDD